MERPTLSGPSRRLLRLCRQELGAGLHLTMGVALFQQPHQPKNRKETADYNLNLSETKRDKYKFILKKKIKILGQEMSDNRNNMKSLDKQMESCIQRARDHIEKFAKIIENQYKNIYNLES